MLKLIHFMQMNKIPSLDDLRNAGIPVDDWGQNGSKTYQDLCELIQRQGAVLGLDSRIIICNKVVRIGVFHVNEDRSYRKTLIEMSKQHKGEQIVADPYEHFRVFGVCKNNNNPFTDIERILAEELKITDPDDYRISYKGTGIVEDEKDFPGLVKKQTVHLSEVTLIRNIKNSYRDSSPGKEILVWV